MQNKKGLRIARLLFWSTGHRPFSRGQKSNAGLAILVGAALVFILVSGSPYLKTIAIDALTVMCVAYSWNLISGYVGYFSFGQIAFYGAGAYVTGLLTTDVGIKWYWAIPLSVVLVMLGSAPFGMLLLRLRGIYFALGTLALTVACQILALDSDILGKGNGLFLPMAASIDDVYLMAVTAALLAVLTTSVIANSRLGLRAMAVRDDEDAIQAVGVRSTRVKLIMFMVSAGMAGMAGCITAWNTGFITPDVAFSSAINVEGIVGALVGGVGTIWGPLIGSGLLQAIISWLGPQASTLVGIGLGVLVMLLVILAPAGIVGFLNRFGLFPRGIVHAPYGLIGRDVADLRPGWLRRDGASLPGDGNTLLSVENLTVRFNGVTAVSGLDLQVDDQEYVAIIGANGAGKTTLLSAISGFVNHVEGRVIVSGRDVSKMSAAGRARSGVVRTFQIPRLAESLSVWENVLLGSLLQSPLKEAATRAGHIGLALGLTPIWFQRVDTLGPGYRRRVEIARVIATRPNVILLDEAMAGMNQEEIGAVQEAVGYLREWGVGAIVDVEHVLTAIRESADRMVAMDFGRVIAQGRPSAVLASDTVIQSYLGKTDRPLANEKRPVSIAPRPMPSAVAGGSRGQGVQIESLVAGYHYIHILWDVSIHLSPGEFVGVLGANGAGKTTLCKAICGVCSVYSGHIEIGDANTIGLAPYEIARLGVAYVPSDRELFGEMTVEENLRLGAVKVRGDVTDSALEHVLSVFPELRTLLRRKAGNLSGGQQQMAAIGRGLMRSPQILLLDEPSTGLAPIVVARLMEELRKLSDDGMSILVLEQNAHETLRFVDRAYVLQEGRVKFQGTSTELAQNASLASAYLGT